MNSNLENLIGILGISHLDGKSQGEIIERVGFLVLKNIILKFVDETNDEKLQILSNLLKTNVSFEEILNFIRAEGVAVDDLITAEMTAIIRDFKKIKLAE